MTNNWIEENLKGCLRMCYKVKERLFEGQSPFQKIEVVDAEGFGKMLFNDSVGMLSERDEFVYHDMIVHVPLYTHPYLIVIYHYAWPYPLP